MFQEKKVKIGKKVKMKSLKQVIDLCLKHKIEFNSFGDGELEVHCEDDWHHSIVFTPKHFGKDFTIKSAVIDFHDGEINSIKYETSKMVLTEDMTIFFNNFPKLTKKQKTAPKLPPEPKVVVSLPAGEGHSEYDMDFLDNDILKVGCNEFTLKQIKKIHRFLGNCLEGLE